MTLLDNHVAYRCIKQLHLSIVFFSSSRLSDHYRTIDIIQYDIHLLPIPNKLHRLYRSIYRRKDNDKY